MEARLRQITIDDVRDGFKRAESGKPTLISFTNHDFRDMKSDIIKIRNMIKKVCKEFSEVKFRYSNAIDAMRGIIDKNDLSNPDFVVNLEKAAKSTLISIKANNDIFGPQPFFAIKTKANEYIWQNLDFQRKNQWSYTFDRETIEIDDVDTIGIAANTSSGVTEIIVINPEEEKIKKKILNN